jgi:hypothetical protein
LEKNKFRNFLIMGNIKNYNFNGLKINLSNSDYWDFFLSMDGNSPNCLPLEEVCSVVWYDFNRADIYENINVTKSIYSLVSWDEATNTGHSLSTFGLTGIDNGRILFDKPEPTIDKSNPELLMALTGSTLFIPPNENRLNLHAVSGTTNTEDPFIYETNLVENLSPLGDYMRFRGGFYQGFYKLDGYDYEVLPTRVKHSWSAEFWLRPESDVVSGKTLNNVYNDPETHANGMFFYMGARSENKFWKEWVGSDTGCTSTCTIDPLDISCTDVIDNWCTVPKENEIILVGEYGFGIPLTPPVIEIELITNEFLIYGRSHDGREPKLVEPEGSFILSNSDDDDSSKHCGVCKRNHDGLGAQTTCSYDGQGIAVIRSSEVVTNNTNPFLVYGRATKNKGENDCGTCSGPNDGFGNETICSFSGFTSPQTEIEYEEDIIDNALGFMITDDGRIRYKLLTVNKACEVTVVKKETIPFLVPSDKWSYIVIKFVAPEKTECELKNSKRRNGKLLYYVNGKLKHIDRDFPEFIGRRLNEYKLKQIGVPFNFSLGGGTQGLIESQTFGGLDQNDRTLPLETNFAGSFIGSISQFKFNICDLTFCKITNSYLENLPRYLNND